MADLTNLLALVRDLRSDPERYRVEFRSAGARLSREDHKLLTLLRFAIKAGEGESGDGLFFMTGLFKAGTTWMGLLLNSHPGLFCGPKEIHSFSAQVTELYTQKRLEELPAGEAEEWGNNILEAKRAALIWQILSVADNSGAKRLGGRGPVANIRQLIRAFPNIKIPVIIRDGRDIAVSAAFFHRKYYNQSYERFFEDSALSRINADYARGWAWQFKDFYSRAISLQREYPSNVIVARYEDLLDDPVREMQAVYSFLSVAADEVTTRAAVDRCSFEKLSGGRKPGEADNSSFFRKGVAGDWRNYFTSDAVVAFKSIAGDFLVEAGYEPSDNWSV